MKTDYEIIKDKYSERMAKACRTLFPTILEQQGSLAKLMLSKFYPNPTIYQDLVLGKTETFKDYIYSFYDFKSEKFETNKTVKELLASKGYDFFECHSEEEIQSFKKYYKKEEAICTFDGGRLNSNYVFFAVKKNVDEIKRENFIKPIREDEYGTSVISIQFSRGSNNALSIKNRYNHMVDNPDATFSNNLDNIVPGLTSAFEKEYNLNINKPVACDLKLSNYELAADGRYYKYNYKLGNICYCPNNIIINNGKVLKADSSRYKIADYFIIDYKEKSIKAYDQLINDSFCCNSLKRIDVRKINDNKNIEIKLTNQEEDTTTIILDESSRIISLTTGKTEMIPDNYLYLNKYLTTLDLPAVKEIGNDVLASNERLASYCLNNVNKIGDDFLANNNLISKIDLPQVKEIGNGFLYYNDLVDEINMPNLQNVGDECFYYNDKIRYLDLSNLENIGEGFFFNALNIREAKLPKLKKFGEGPFGNNMDIYIQLMEVVAKNDRKNNQEPDSEIEQTQSSKRRI